ncbi:hypothetical protein [Sporosarcina jiandibaonis]
MLVAKAVYVMKRSGTKRLIVTACIGGGRELLYCLKNKSGVLK